MQIDDMESADRAVQIVPHIQQQDHRHQVQETHFVSAEGNRFGVVLGNLRW
jgi:hypothetical protein